jgi:hypothetical protein
VQVRLILAVVSSNPGLDNQGWLLSAFFVSDNQANVIEEEIGITSGITKPDFFIFRFYRLL